MKFRKPLFYAVVITAISYACCFAHSAVTHSVAESPDMAETPTLHEFLTDSVYFNGKYSDTFQDMQDVQIVDAELYGISPLSNTDSILLLVNEGKLVEIPDCIFYEIDEVSHPYLTPSAKELLDEIARRYHQIEKSQKQLRLTGCLRTQETISKLMRRNRNSIKNSCHLYGTTFDISYRFLTPKEKRSLAQVLYELQQGGYCYVKYERKQPCFHITVRF